MTSAERAALASAADLTVSSDVEVLGLRVRSGSVPATGQSAGAGGRLWGFSDLALDGSRLQLELEVAQAGAPLSKLLPEGALAVVNGGYFEADFRPSAWLKSRGVELSPKRDTARGGVLALTDSSTYLGPFSGLSFEPELALQSFPLIVEADGELGIHSDDGHRAQRTVACLVGDTLHFIVIAAPRGDGPTLFESATLLRDAPPRGFGCRVALNLDGGPSSGVWFDERVPARQRPPLSNVGNAIAIVPRRPEPRPHAPSDRE